MNLKEIKELINLMNENNLTELEIEKDGLRIRLKKVTLEEEGISSRSIVIEKERVAEAAKTLEISTSIDKMSPKTVEIKAPMVGTFFRAPSPESPPYVEIGQVVEAGQVVCIIEAMKLMNEIKSEIKGKILEIFVDNTEPVEFGQPMFLVEPM